MNRSPVIDDLFDEFGTDASLDRLPLHKNPGLEIVYLKHGHVTWQCDGKHEAIPPESVYFTLPWHAHGSIFDFEPGHEWHFIVLRLKEKKRGPFRLPADLKIDSKTSRQLTRVLLNTERHAWPATSLISTLMPELVRELEKPGLAHQQRVISITTQVIIELVRIITYYEKCDQLKQKNSSGIPELINRINSDYGREWNLNEMAEIAGLRKSQMIPVFHNHTGNTPMVYLTRIRINMARHLLRNTKTDITNIAMKCGFGSSQYFANVFRKMTGTTPSDYRRKGPPPLILPRSRPLQGNIKSEVRQASQ